MGDCERAKSRRWSDQTPTESRSGDSEPRQISGTAAPSGPESMPHRSQIDIAPIKIDIAPIINRRDDYQR